MWSSLPVQRKCSSEEEEGLARIKLSANQSSLLTLMPSLLDDSGTPPARTQVELRNSYDGVYETCDKLGCCRRRD